jgi:hypothetical protein
VTVVNGTAVKGQTTVERMKGEDLLHESYVPSKFTTRKARLVRMDQTLEAQIADKLRGRLTFADASLESQPLLDAP